MEYIHYGHKKFDKDLFEPIKNSFVKPTGGFWASPINAELGWKEWNDETHLTECTKDNSFTFSLKPNAKVIQIHNIEDLFKLPRYDYLNREYNYYYDIFPDSYDIDFEKCIEMGIDAIELCNIKRTLYYALYGWDCESILILNKDIIEVE